MRGYGAGGWVLGAIEWVKALIVAITYSYEAIDSELSGIAAEMRREDKRKAKAETQRKATFWDRAKHDREELWVKHQREIAEQRARTEAAKAAKLAEERIEQEKRNELEALWATSAPKSTKWSYKL